MPGVLQVTFYSNKYQSRCCESDSDDDTYHHVYNHRHDSNHLETLLDESLLERSSSYGSSSSSSSSNWDDPNSNSLPSLPSPSPSTSTIPFSWSLPTIILSSTTQYPIIPSSEYLYNNKGDEDISHQQEQYPLIFHSRVAEALGVEEGDEVSFTLHDFITNHGITAASNSIATKWTTMGQQRQLQQQSQENPFFSLRACIYPTAPFDVAIDTNSHDDMARTIFDGTIHTIFGNFLLLTNGLKFKMSEQERIYRPIKTMKDLKCAGILLQVEGTTTTDDCYSSHQFDYDEQDCGGGAGCGFCIYASSPLTNILKPSDQLVQGYRYLHNANNIQEALAFGLIEALLWTFRLDYQTVWIVGSADQIFRNLLQKHQGDHTTTSTTTRSPRLQSLTTYLHTMLERARRLRIQFKFLSSKQTAEAMDLATTAILEHRNETWCHWSTINYQSQRNLPFSESMVRQVSI